MEALAGDGGVGRARVVVAPGSVPFGKKGTVSCVRVRGLPADLLRVQGAVDGVRSGALRFVAVIAWLDARAVVVQSIAEQGSASFGHLASVSSSLLRQCQGSTALLTSTIGPSLFSPHINVATVRHWSGSVNQFPSISLLLRVLAPGAPVGVSGGGDLTSEIAYGNHLGIAQHDVEIHKRICEDVVYGRALVFDLRFDGNFLGLRISPLSVVLEPKFRIIHDLTFARAGGRTSVNVYTDFDSAPPSELGHVLREVILQVMVLRQTHGSSARIILCRVDVKYVFRQVLVDPAGAPAFGNELSDCVVVDLRLQFGWRNSPGFWGLVAYALEYAHIHSTFQDADVSQEWAAAIAHVGISPPRGGSSCLYPGELWACFWLWWQRRELLLCEVLRRRWHSRRVAMVAGRSPLFARCPIAGIGPFLLVGRTERGVSDPPLLSARKSLTGTRNWRCWVGSLTRRRLRLRCRPISASSCKISLRSGPRLVHLLQRGRCRSSLASLHMSPFLCVLGGFS